ncbi:MAG: hypothetical protein AAB263_19600 [Planctomycetota bacterium]
MKKWIIVPLIVVAMYLAAYGAWRWWRGSIEIASLMNPNEPLDAINGGEQAEHVVNVWIPATLAKSVRDEGDAYVKSWDALLFYPCLIGECWMRCPGPFLILEREPCNDTYDKIVRDRGRL